MHLLVGLGNPGDQYRNNRHNIGFMAADAIARRHGFPPFHQKFSGLITEGTLEGERTLILKPQTFMNESGNSVAAAARFYKIATADVVVLHDELDLVPGKVRLKTGGGAGGHNGIRSIDPQIGPDYKRVRLGIGHPGHKGAVMHYVLGDFSKVDEDWLAPLLEAVGANAGLLISGDDNGFMNKLALAVNGDGAERAQRPRPGQSHIRAARPAKPVVKLPQTGPMANMLKKLFGDD